MDDDPKRRFRENVTEIAATVVTGIWLAALLTGQGWWLGALLIGYIVVVPLIALLFGDEEDRAEWWDDDWWDEESESADEPADSGETSVAPRSNRDALETLRDRYAAGELTDEQFERKLERLLETETLEDADRWRRQARAERDRQRDANDDRDRDLEYET
ncbi:SHOCT domain-containing protein [Natronobacterium texcoconense]|uniref:Short C-terminal domain-containing protein n=1 Tax=Natronobacterium texcoconense TaxID=1095778 RepID=A0A1H1IDX1_NATTX|nr:SHOCT domain-containing protein [Natronobacterium texcoconense]SDR35881.1 Short C-terminal domain-containing protein [Natronobacterium texcoconense]